MIDILFAGLEGCWTLQRTIYGFGVMDGSVGIREVGPGILEYREEGLVELDSGKSFVATRAYYYCLEGEDIVVRFRLSEEACDVLHRLRFAFGDHGAWPSEASDIHFCGKDVYQGYYSFPTPDEIRIRMVIIGPKKDSVIETRLSRTS